MNSRLTIISFAALLLLTGFPMAALGQGITVTPTSLSIGEGGTGTFTVVLTTQPTDNVTIGVSSSDTSAGTVPAASASLEFTPDGGLTPWDAPQTVTVTAVPDHIVGSAAAPYVIELDVASSADLSYNGMDPDDVAVTNTDTDAAGFKIVPSGGLTTDEDGTQATFTVSLESKPSDDVTVAVSSDNTDEGTVLPATLTFTPDNWNGLQTVTVTGVADGVVDGNQSYNIVMGAATSADTDYDGLDPADVSATNTDMNSAGFTVTPTTGLVTTEDGGQADFTVKLNSKPTDNVTIDVHSDDPDEGTASESVLTFTLDNWDAEQVVTVTGVSDGIVGDGDQPYNIVLDPASSPDTNYNGQDPADVSVTNTDTDSPGFYVAEVGPEDPATGYLKTTEDGDWATFTVNLKSKPQSGEVWLDVMSNSPEGSVLPSGGRTLVFTQSNWKVPQTITVQGLDDSVTDGNQVYSVGLTPDTFITQDPDYQTAPPDVTMINIDNESAGFVIGAVSGNITEAGITATFTVKLISQPQGDVTISVSSMDISEGTALPGTLSFTTATWADSQTVTVTGQDDDIADGDQSFYVRLDPSLSPDTVYKGLAPQNVSVTNEDDDSAGFTVGPATLQTTEDGGTATFTVKLNSQPTGDVVIGVTSGDTTEGSVDKDSLTFTTLNWDANQTVTVTGLDDTGMDGDQTYTVELLVDTSADPSYSALNPDDITVTNVDTDKPGFTITLPPEETDGILDTSEDGDVAAFTIRLNTEPAADVTVDVSSDDETEGTVSASSLTFTPLNWDAYQVVSITGVDDNETDGNITYSIVLSAATSDDPDYSGVTPADSPVQVINTDNNLPGFTISPATGLSTSEDGGTATFAVTLNAPPSADVTVAVSSSDETEGTVSPATLTFTPDNWNASDHIVTVTGVDDAATPVADGDQQYSIILAPASSADSDYDGMDPDDVMVTNMDNETPGFVVQPTTGLTTSEDGDTTTFTVELTGPPTADVVIAVSSSDPGEGAVIPSALTLTPANWNSSIHIVTVTGVDDGVTDGDQSYEIILGTATSGDSNYNGKDPDDVPIINTDNDKPGFILGPGGDTTEDGGTSDFTVRLQSQPLANVTIGLDSLDKTEGTIEISGLVFTPGNWDTDQTVTVTGVDDTVIDGNQSYSIELAAVISTDDNYNGLNPDDVVLTNADNDKAAVIVGATDGDTTEDGGTAEFTVTLQTQPVADVTVSVNSSDTGEGTVSPQELVFTTTDWNTPHSVTVTGEDDYLMDGSQSFNILLGTASSDDGNYDGVTPSPASVPVNNLDNDSPDFVIEPKTGLQTTEPGETDTFTIRLISQPDFDVTISLSSLNEDEGTVSPLSLTFTPANWNADQTVTLTGVDDTDEDGDQNYTIVIDPASSADPKYAGQYPGNVSAVNVDDDGIVCDPGDINGDGSINLDDAILGLQILSGMNKPVYKVCSADEDSQIGMEEVLNALREAVK